MQEYSSEQEQIEAIKKWLRENGMAIIVGVVVGFGGLYGWQQWQQFVNSQAEQASSKYSQILINLDNANVAGVPQATDDLIENYAGTPYASLGALAAAKVAAVGGDYETAKERLQWVITSSKQAELVPLARLRLARLFVLEKNVDAAANLIEAYDYPAGYAARVAELQGDLHILRGETALARVAYTTAISTELPVQNREMIQMKLDALEPIALEVIKQSDSSDAVSESE